MRLKSIGKHRIALYVNDENVTYFDRYGVENIRNKNITKIYRIQAYGSIMSAYFCIEFVDFMLKGKSLLEQTNLFSQIHYKNNDEITLKYFQ